MEEQIARVHELVATPLLRPALFERLCIAPPRRILFYRPPGSDKTLLARAVAARTSAAFFQNSRPEIVSKHYGESEAAPRQVFASASKSAPPSSSSIRSTPSPRAATAFPPKSKSNGSWWPSF
jgi:transitional endoplasmic reticulum ATPase